MKPVKVTIPPEQGNRRGDELEFVLSLFQTYVEAIYLNDDEVLGQQTSEDHHIFQWLKFQASRGTTEAEVLRMGIIRQIHSFGCNVCFF